MPIFYTIAHGEKLLETAGNFPWPYEIGICFESIKHPIGFGEGVAHGSAWCSVSSSEALEDTWRKFFDITDAMWLIPYIEEAMIGEPFPKNEMLSKYQSITGKQPKTYEANIT